MGVDCYKAVVRKTRNLETTRNTVENKQMLETAEIQTRGKIVKGTDEMVFVAKIRRIRNIQDIRNWWHWYEGIDSKGYKT